MILEGIVTTMSPDGTVNVAPMGPRVPDDRPSEWREFDLMPFKTSRTFSNLKAHGQGVLHITDDVLLFARAIAGSASPPLVQAERVACLRLADCCRFFEFEARLVEESERTKFRALVVNSVGVRDWFGFNRAKHAVVEAAVLASRRDILPAQQLARDFERLRPAITKTGGPAEIEAFNLLDDFTFRRTDL